jgi:hypothetical protein
MTYLMGSRSRDPRDLTSVGFYMTDGDVLVWIISVDYDGALGEDARSPDDLIQITPIDLLQRWRRVKTDLKAAIEEEAAEDWQPSLSPDKFDLSQGRDAG